MSLAPGQNLGHYRIERLIGQGGMGAVYLARDTKLDRDVALKVLPDAVAGDPERLVRFEREARAVAALNHPHIVTIHSVEEAAGTRFLTMELVEGQSLDRGIPSSGLPLPRVFDVGIALADALAAAHEKGVVHRDLKPANVMLTKDGRVKVLDFGLAKLGLASAEGGAAPDHPLTAATTQLDPAGGPLTSAGGVMGTVPYMSPEQAAGENVDARTDVFALGVVLYEMATGHRPFRGKNNVETISSILRDVPQPVTEFRHDAPRELARIIDHCLQKVPRERFQTARDVHNELRTLRKDVESGVYGSELSPSPAGATKSQGATWLWIGGAIAAVAMATGLYWFQNREAEAPSNAAAAPDARSVAVLPFVNVSSDKEQEYFSDGISEELLNLLAKIPELKVAARTSSFSFKGKGLEIPEIARQLKVVHVLEGSVRKSGRQVRITAQLIHAADGFRVWSETYDRKLDDIFKIQDEIAAEVVKELKVTLLGPAPKARSTDPEAYTRFLQAVQLGRQATAEGFEKSDALLREVLAVDGRYAPAWSELGRNFSNKSVSGLVPVPEASARGREAYDKALAIDPDYAPAHAGRGYIAFSLDNDFATAAASLERALELDPTDISALNIAASFLALLGRLNEAQVVREALNRRDPLNLSVLFNYGNLLRYLGKFDEAIAAYRTLLSLSPNRGVAHATLSVTLLLKGDAAGALAEIEQEPSEIWRMICFPLIYDALGRKADADAARAALIAKHPKDLAYHIAYGFAFRGDADKAFEWLERAVVQKDPGLGYIATERHFDRIHSDPRWQPFLRKVGRAPEQLAAIPFKVTLPK